jgi:hypothetical protein
VSKFFREPMATNTHPTALERYRESFEPLGRGQPYRMLLPPPHAMILSQVRR